MPRNTKEYIFGVLFLGHLSDLFDQEREQPGKELKIKGMADGIIAAPLTNPDKYTFFVPPTRQLPLQATNRAGPMRALLYQPPSQPHLDASIQYRERGVQCKARLSQQHQVIA